MSLLLAVSRLEVAFATASLILFQETSDLRPGLVGWAWVLPHLDFMVVQLQKPFKNTFAWLKELVAYADKRIQILPEVALNRMKLLLS